MDATSESFLRLAQKASSVASLAANSAANSAASSAANSANWLTVVASSSVRWMYLYLYSSRGGFMIFRPAH